MSSIEYQILSEAFQSLTRAFSQFQDKIPTWITHEELQQREKCIHQIVGTKYLELQAKMDFDGREARRRLNKAEAEILRLQQNLQYLSSQVASIPANTNCMMAEVKELREELNKFQEKFEKIPPLKFQWRETGARTPHH